MIFNHARGLILAGVVISVGAVFATGGAAAAENPRSVSVSGECIRTVVPDRGAVTITAEVKESDAKRARNGANRIYEAVRSRVSKLNLPDANVSTAEYLSEEVREWEKDKMVSKGFRTRIALRVETSDHSRLSEVIEIASREGVKQMSGMSCTPAGSSSCCSWSSA